MFNSNIEILEAVVRCIPNPEQIKLMDTEREDSAIRFTWRGTRFRVNKYGGVEQVGFMQLYTSNESIMFQRLIRLNHEAE